MKVDFEEEEIKGILKCYFDMENNTDCNVSIDAEECDHDCYVWAIIRSNMQVLDKSFFATITLNEGELEEILTSIFKSEGYDVHGVLFQKGVTEEIKGYPKAYFNGVSLSLVNQKKKTKSIGNK